MRLPRLDVEGPIEGAATFPQDKWSNEKDA
jgi:hypothetical protein